jgi:hypothetical protein
MSKEGIWPILGMIFLIGILCPFVAFLILRKISDLKNLAIRIWLASFGIGFAFFPLLIQRKHWELKMVLWRNTFWFVTFIIQMDNNFWEELGKLLTIFIICWIYKSKIKDYLLKASNALAFGFWVGLAYGVGEAITLMLAMLLPKYSQFTGMKLFLAFVTWASVYERFLAIQIHAMMGALVGMGVFHLFKNRSWIRLILFSILAMLYHELVDGTVLLIMYYPNLSWVKSLAKNLVYVILPTLVALGYMIVFLISRIIKKKEVEFKESISQ